MKNIANINKKTLGIGCLSISLILIAIIAVFIFSNKRNGNVEGVETLRMIEFDHKNTKEIFNSNFQVSSNNTKSEDVKSATTADLDNIDITVTPTTSNDDKVVTNKIILPINTLAIPKLNVKTSVIEDVDGEKAIHIGAWLYPNSYEGEGEKIFLGHRRFWGADDPRSFWNLDQLTIGDTIHYSDAKGNIYNYSVKSVSVRNAGDLSTLKPSKENMIKVISCSTADGSAGSSENRIVVIATQI